MEDGAKMSDGAYASRMRHETFFTHATDRLRIDLSAPTKVVVFHGHAGALRHSGGRKANGDKAALSLPSGR